MALEAFSNVAQVTEREHLEPLIKRIDRFFDRSRAEPLATPPEYPLAMRVFHAVKGRPRHWNTIKAVAHEDFEEWLKFLPFRLLGAGRASQGIAVCDAWSTVMAPGQFKCLKAYLLAQTCRDVKAKKQTAEALSRHRSEWEAFIWAAETFGVLGDVKRQERYYRKALALTKIDDDHEDALRQLLLFLDDHGRKKDISAIKRAERIADLEAKTGRPVGEGPGAAFSNW